jgi:hypothetical protein
MMRRPISSPYGLAGDLADEDAGHHVVGVRVAPAGAGCEHRRVGEGGVQELRRVVVGEGVRQDVLRVEVGQVVGQTAGVLEQLAHRDVAPVVAVALIRPGR